MPSAARNNKCSRVRNHDRDWIERSNGMSGDSLWVITLRALSMETVVLNAGSSSRLCQPSSKATRASGSNGRTY